jgi:hypothetical protein
MNNGDPKELGKKFAAQLANEVMSTIINSSDLNETCKYALNKFGDFA